MPSRIKIVNGSEHIFSVEEAARRLKGLGLRVSEIEDALVTPYQIEYPFTAGARSADASMILEVQGTHYALTMLQKLVN